MTDLIVNFGGPRDLDEIAPFLIELLTDRDVVRTRLPNFLHKYLFTRIAKKRALKIRPDYEEIGGKSPIYFDTETLAAELSALTFHRYLPATHASSLQALESCPSEIIRVFPLFPQFSYATTGSIARFFLNHLSPRTRNKMQWIQSYAAHPAFTSAYQSRIREFLHAQKIEEEQCAILFSAHGIPQSFVDTGDIYETECYRSFDAIKAAFPNAICHLSFQSKFGRGEWIKPYTEETCSSLTWTQNRSHVVIVPISFTSDHIETLFEVEQLYLPLLRKQGVKAYRCPALNLDWAAAVRDILDSSSLVKTERLVRK